MAPFWQFTRTKHATRDCRNKRLFGMQRQRIHRGVNEYVQSYGWWRDRLLEKHIIAENTYDRRDYSVGSVIFWETDLLFNQETKFQILPLEYIYLLHKVREIV